MGKVYILLGFVSAMSLVMALAITVLILRMREPEVDGFLETEEYPECIRRERRSKRALALLVILSAWASATFGLVLVWWR